MKSSLVIKTKWKPFFWPNGQFCVTKGPKASIVDLTGEGSSQSIFGFHVARKQKPIHYHIIRVKFPSKCFMHHWGTKNFSRANHLSFFAKTTNFDKNTPDDVGSETLITHIFVRILLIHENFVTWFQFLEWFEFALVWFQEIVIDNFWNNLGRLPIKAPHKIKKFLT